MAWQELLALFQSSSTDSPDAVITRMLGKLDELLAALEAVATAEKDKAAPAQTRIKWRAAAFSCLPLEQLEGNVSRAHRTRLRSTRKTLQTTLDKLEDATPISASIELADLDGVRDALLSARRELERIGSTFRDDARRSRILRGTLLLTPAILGSAAVYYLRTDRGLRTEQIEVLAPSAAYAPLKKNDESLTLRDDYLTDYMAEFSKHYFGHPSQFDSIYYDHRAEKKEGDPDTKDGKPQPQRRTLHHKIDLRNVSQGHTAYLSSIEAVVDVIEKADFPWTRLTVTPRVTAVAEIPSSHRSLVISSDGIGPALDVKETLTTRNGLQLSKQEVPILHQNRIAPFQFLLVDTVAISGNNDGLAAPLFYHLPAPPAAPAPQFFEVKPPRPGEPAKDKKCLPNSNAADFGFWEEVRSLSRLRQLVPTAYAEPYTLAVSYASLKGTNDTLHMSGTLDPSEAFYSGNPRLQKRDPRCLMIEREIDTLVDRADVPLEQLAFFFAPDKDLTHPKGTDLITAHLGIDLLDLTIGRHVAATQPLDSFLNPQGVLAVNLTLHMPASLRYAVRILVNGRPAASYRFDGLQPDFLTFAEEGPNVAVSRLRKIFELEQQRGGPSISK